MKAATRLSIALMVVAITAACGDIHTSSGGGRSSGPTINVSGTWSGSTYEFLAADFTTYPISVTLMQHGDTLTGSVSMPDCFPESPITSGRVSHVQGSDLNLVNFTATGPDRQFKFFAGQVSNRGMSLTGLAELTTGAPGCPSFDFGGANLERTS